jgi:uncharacterized membrane protein
MRARDFLSGSPFGSGVVGSLTTLGVVAAGVAIVETALVPGLLIGGAAILAPRLLPRGASTGSRNRPRRRPEPSAALAAPTAERPEPGEAAPFDVWRAATKTITYRVMLTTVDFGANYFVIGELATAAGLSGLSLVAGPIAYFAHEAAWHYYGPASARQFNPLEATVNVPIPGAIEGESGRTHIAGLKVSRALAKTVTYEGVTAVSEFGVNYFFVRDLVAAAGLTAFSVAISPFVYYVHEKAWDYYEAATARTPPHRAIPLAPAA